eukprot:615645-Prymnesium_polylepis.1
MRCRRSRRPPMRARRCAPSWRPSPGRAPSAPSPTPSSTLRRRPACGRRAGAQARTPASLEPWAWGERAWGTAAAP